MDSRPYDVLIIDDDQVIRFYVSLCLSEAGFRCLNAGDGQEGIQLLENLPSTSLPPIALVDVRMPVLDGPGFVLEARRRNLLKETEVVFVTSENMATEVLIDEVSYKVMTKPHNLDTLIPYINGKIRPDQGDSISVSPGAF